MRRFLLLNIYNFKNSKTLEEQLISFSTDYFLERKRERERVLVRNSLTSASRYRDPRAAITGRTRSRPRLRSRPRFRSTATGPRRTRTRSRIWPRCSSRFESSWIRFSDADAEPDANSASLTAVSQKHRLGFRMALADHRPCHEHLMKANSRFLRRKPRRLC